MTTRAAPAALTTLRAPRVEDWVDIPDYDGFQARIWVNFPNRLLQALNSGDETAGRAALSSIVLEHNGWGDAEGVPFPPADHEDFWESLPMHLAVRVMKAIQTKASELPNSRPATKQRSSSG